MRRTAAAVLVGAAAGLTGLVGVVTPSTAAPPDGSGSTVSYASAQAQTKPVRDMPVHTSSDEPKRAHPLRLTGQSGPTSSGASKKPGGGGGGSGGGGGTPGGSDGSNFPSAFLGAGQDGIGNGVDNFTPDAAPPDTNGAAGYGLDANGKTVHQYVEWVNESFAVFTIDDKDNLIVAKPPTAGNTLFSALGSTNGCAVNNDGDPIAQFDKINQRWVLAQFSVTNPSTYGYLECVAVSQTADATGAYNVFSFSYGPNDFIDYPKIGIWPGAYFVTYNIFHGNAFAGPRICAWDSHAMQTYDPTHPTPVAQVCQDLSSSYGSVLPGDVDGTPPAAGAADTLASFGSNSLLLWQAKPDFTGGSLGLASLTPTTLAVPSFAEACNGGTCIPQPRGQLDSLGDRLMYRLAFRTVGGIDHLVVTHSVKTSTAASGVRWYDVTRTSATPTAAPGPWTVNQAGTYSPDGTSRWMASAAMDRAGNIAVGYSASSTSVNPGVRLAARLAGATSTKGLLSNEDVALVGDGYQSGYGLTRWGDYSAMSIDPKDDCTFWYANEYEKKTGAFNWNTWIVPFRLNGC